MRFLQFLSEKTEKRKVIVVYGGGFQPFHAGHMSSYEEAKRKLPSAEFYVASSNDVKLRPIPFADKKFLAEQAGVTDHFVQVVQPVNPREILEKYNENKDILILVRSERDPVNYTKKDGSPAYYQPFKSIKECKPFNPKTGHGYVLVTKKKIFKVLGKEVFSGSQVREMYSKADDTERKNIIKDLYPRANNPQKVKKLLDKYIGGLSESIDTDFEELISEGVHDKGIFKAVFLGGGPGSGKDYVLDRTLSGHGLTELNSDKAFEYLMDKKNLDMKMPENERQARDIVRGKAKSMTELRQKLALLGRNGVIINGTGDDPDKIKRIKQRLEELGYETSMVMVNTRDEVSAARNVERGQRGGRTVPEEIRKQKWDAVQKARPTLAKLFGDNYREFDNSEDLRTARPEVIQQKEKELMDVYKSVQKFVSKPPKNDMSKEWIAAELQKKDTQKVDRKAEVVPHEGSKAAEQARQMGLEYYGFGRYGKNGKVTHRSIHDKLTDVSKFTQQNVDIPVASSSGSGSSSIPAKQKEKLQKLRTQSKLPKVNEEFEELFSEDLRQWFDPNHPKGGWKRINSKGEAIGPCAREPGEGKPKCMSNEKRAKLTPKERAAAVRAKRRHDPNPERQGKPINVSNFGKGKISESYDLSDSGALNILLLGTRIDEIDLDDNYTHQEEKKYLKDGNGRIRVFMLRRAAAKEAHTKNGTVVPYKNGYVVQLNEEKDHGNSTIPERFILGQQTRTSENTSARSAYLTEGRTNFREYAELTTGQEYARGEGITSSGNEAPASSKKITLSKIRERQKETQVKESIDKGIEPGMSMSASGENLGRPGLKTKQNKKPFEEAIGAGGEDINSMGAKKEDELKKLGISLTTFKARRPIG